MSLNFDNIEMLYCSENNVKYVCDIEGPFPSYREAVNFRIAHNLQRDFVKESRRQFVKIIDKVIITYFLYICTELLLK